jgi:hypothetical protein
MPQAIPAVAMAVGGAATAVGFGATAVTVITAATSFALGAATLYGINAGLQALAGGPPDVPSLDTQNGGRQLSFAPSSNAPRQIIYGETLVRGQPVLIKTSGTDRKYLDMVIAIGDAGPYESIEAIYFNEDELTLDGSGNVTAPSKYAGFAQIVTTLGSESQSAISDAVTNITEWTSSHTGKGVCHAYVRLTWDPDVWTGGQPQIKFKVRGRKVYDPRLDSTNGGSGSHRKDDATTWEWSNNRVLWALDWVRGVKMNGERVAGLGAPNTLIDWGTWADAADCADETVSVNGGGTIARYSGGGAQIGSDDDPAGIARAMAQCFAGEFAPRSGYIACFAGEARTATVTLSDDDLASAIKLRTTQSMRDTVNTMQAQYREPEEDYSFTDAPQYQNASWVSDDGEEYYRQISLPFEDDHRRAQRISKIIAARIREPRRLEATFKQKAMQVREGDTFTWSSDRFPAGVVGKFVCVDRKINPDGTVFISARSEDDTKYNWTPASEEATRTTPASISEPSTSTTIPASSWDPSTGRDATIGALPEYTLGLWFTLPAYDVNASGAVGFEDTVDLGSGYIRDSGGNNLTDTNTLNTSIEVDGGTGQLTNIGGAATVIANNFIGIAPAGDITGIGTGNGTFIANANIQLAADGILTGGGTSSPVNALLLLNGPADANATAGATWGSDVSAIPSNLSALSGSESIDNTGITVNAGTGALSGIGTGDGTVVRNTEISLSSSGVLSGGGTSVQVDATLITNGVAESGATAGATWTGAGANISAIPSNLSALSGSEDIENADITIDGNGILQGIGTASKTVDNQQVTVNGTTGVLEGIGTGSVVVNNQKITVDGGGVLQGIGTASKTVDNQQVTVDGSGILQGIGTGSVVVNNANIVASNIPSLDASKITTGTFGTARIASSAITNDKVSDTAAIKNFKIDYPNRTDTLTSDTTITTTQVSALEISFTSVGTTNFVFFTGTDLRFEQSGTDQSQNDTDTMEWELRESNTSGSLIGNIIASGTILFEELLGVNLADTDDFHNQVLKDGPYSLSLTGTVYVALLLKMTAGEGYLEGSAAPRATLQATGFGDIQ